MVQQRKFVGDLKSSTQLTAVVLMWFCMLLVLISGTSCLKNIKPNNVVKSTVVFVEKM